jgi:hypothetical protein
MKKYNANSGWFQERKRHSLARLGVKTGHRQKPDLASISMNGMNYKTVEPQMEQEAEVSYSPTTVSSAPIPSDEQIMQDADGIMAESESEAEAVEPVLEYEEPEIDETQIGEDADEVDIELADLEADASPVTGKTNWKDALKNVGKSVGMGIISFYGSDSGGSHVDSKIDELNMHKDELVTKVGIIQSVKNKILSPEYRQKHGIKAQLDSLKRVDNILSEPKHGIAKLNEAIGQLKLKKIKAERQAQLKASGIKPESTSSSIFPSFGEILNPDRLVTKKAEQKPAENNGVLGSVSIFPSFDEIMNPDKLRSKR